MPIDNNRNDDINFEIIEKIGTLRASASGWARELNLIRWNGSKPKFDIRDWSEDHAKCSKGITLTQVEMRRIMEWIEKRGLEIADPQYPDTQEPEFAVFEDVDPGLMDPIQ